MKNFLLGLLINALWLYVVLPIFFVGLGACVWVPVFFEFKGASIVGVVISISTLVIASIVEYKLESD